MLRKCSTIIIHALSWFCNRLASEVLPLWNDCPWTGKKVSSGHNNTQMLSSQVQPNYQVMMLPSGRLGDQACPLGTIIKADVSQSSASRFNYNSPPLFFSINNALLTWIYVSNAWYLIRKLPPLVKAWSLDVRVRDRPNELPTKLPNNSLWSYLR